MNWIIQNNPDVAPELVAIILNHQATMTEAIDRTERPEVEVKNHRVFTMDSTKERIFRAVTHDSIESAKLTVVTFRMSVRDISQMLMQCLFNKKFISIIRLP